VVEKGLFGSLKAVKVGVGLGVEGELRQMLDFLEAKEWPLVSHVPYSEGKQKGGILSDRSDTAVLHSMDRDDEKTVGLKLVSVTPLNLLPSVLVNGGEEVRTAVNCYEFDLRVSGSSAILSSITAK